MTRFSILAATAALLLASVAVAELVYYDETGAPAVPRHAMLCSPGACKALTFFYKGPKPVDVAMTTPDGGATWLTTSSTPEIVTGSGTHNITLTECAKNDVGVQNYVVKVVDEADNTATIEGTFICAGICIQDDTGKCISGDDGEGVTVGASGSKTYDVKAVDLSGNAFDPSGTTIVPTEKTGTYMEEVNMASTKFGADSFTLALNAGRYGTGEFILTLTNSELTLDGEDYETVLICKQTIPENPLCYAVGGEYEIESSGQVRIPMYNLEKPPRSSAVSEVTLSLGGSVYEYSSASSRDLPTQMMVFNPLTTGDADLVCDGVKAEVNGNGGVVTITGEVPEAPKEKSLLAKYYTKALARKDGFDILSATLVIKDSHPDLLLQSHMVKILDQFCEVTGGQDCVLESVHAGSAECNIATAVCQGCGEESETAFENSLADCSFQKAVGETCENMYSQNTAVLAGNAIGTGGTLGATVGLATWTIVLIAVVGAFAIILLIMLALWAVYRRNAEQSESDYSSSGPLGVPDPSDLLYEQSIVRDIYGRGDFPEGGPTAAAAAERAREADLREEFPRPPSSSGVSRAAQTDDASSTYSV